MGSETVCETNQPTTRRQTQRHERPLALIASGRTCRLRHVDQRRVVGSITGETGSQQVKVRDVATSHLQPCRSASLPSFDASTCFR